MSVRSRNQDVRAIILDGVDRLLARYGYQKMTMEDIAREAGLAKGTLYAYFSSKEEMALATIDRPIGLLIEELRKIAHSTGTPADRLERMLTCRVLFLFDRAQEKSHALDDMYMALRPQYKAHRDRYVSSEAEVFAEVLAEGRQSGDFDVDDPLEVAYEFILATSTLTPFSLSVRELGERGWIERKIHRISALLIHGIAQQR
jgi:TetR/AcrR family transcriptional regulator, fatty acid metabolism regulator protein